MLNAIKRFLGIAPDVYSLPYEQRLFIVSVGTAIERVK